MPTFIMSPEIRVYIETEKHGTLNVSSDLVEGSMVRRTDGVSTFNFSMNNPRRKYDRIFVPNDRIIVLAKRLKWLRIFTGYLNSVPLFSAWPTVVNLESSCSLKRLQYWYWDPDNAATQNMIREALGADVAHVTSDNSVGNVILTILKNVVGWPDSKVHIGEIPEDWFSLASVLAAKVISATDESAAIGEAFANGLSSNSTIGGGGTSSNVTGLLNAGTYGGVRLEDFQLRFVEIIFSQGRIMGMSDHDIVIALATAMQESKLTNLSGGDGDSIGLFQQISSWGTAAQRHDPIYSTTKFFKALRSVTNRDTQIEWMSAYAVQRCNAAFKTFYQQWVPMAFALVDKINALASSVPPPPGGTSTDKTGDSFLATALQLVERYPNIPYKQGDRSAVFLRKDPPNYLDCSSFVMAIWMRAVGNIRAIPTVSALQAGWCKKISTADALNTPGALLFLTTNGAASGVHHVEVSLGNGKYAVGAHHTGVPASVGDYWGPSEALAYWDFGGLMPGITYGSVGGGGGPTYKGGTTPTGPVIVGGTGQWPVSSHVVTTPFHEPGDWAAGYHTGVDFGYANLGDPVSSIAAGKVTLAANDGDYGNSVEVMNGSVMLKYCHMNLITVNVGDLVEPGTKVGEVGNTGRSFGAHLHLEYRTTPFLYANQVHDPIPVITDGVTSEGGITSGSGTSSGGGSTVFGGGGGAGIWAPTVLANTLPGYNPNDPIDRLFGESPWTPISSTSTANATLANSLGGILTLLNDQPLLPYLINLFSAQMRSFCSAPNGDLIAWFPDYYGLWGTAAKLRLEPIEIMDFQVTWSDDKFVTHQFAVSGAYTQLDVSTGSIQTQFLPVFETRGAVTIDLPEVLYSLFGIEVSDAVSFTRWVYRKFGARPDFQQVQGTGPKSDFFSALFYFMRQWAFQYRADIPTTWMPEAWPGMLVQVPDFDFQAYITSVSHNFSFGEGGGFSTSMTVAAPAYMPRTGKANRDHVLFGLPLAGGYTTGAGLGNPPVIIPHAPPPISIVPHGGLIEPPVGV